MKHVRVKVRGLVQGVSFRANTRAQAQALGIAGWVSNCADGSVYLEAEGEEQAVEALLDWLRQGPDPARVDEVLVEAGATQGFAGFTIRYG